MNDFVYIVGKRRVIKTLLCWPSVCDDFMPLVAKLHKIYEKCVIFYI